jgi:hypothetical protein
MSWHPFYDQACIWPATSIDNIFFPYLFSLFLNFNAYLLEISNHPFNLLFLQILFMFFLLLFILFGIINEIEILFQLYPL